MGLLQHMGYGWSLIAVDHMGRMWAHGMGGV
jgi:hypothetical protein